MSTCFQHFCRNSMIYPYSLFSRIGVMKHPEGLGCWRCIKQTRIWCQLAFNISLSSNTNLSFKLKFVIVRKVASVSSASCLLVQYLEKFSLFTGWSLSRLVRTCCSLVVFAVAFFDLLSFLDVVVSMSISKSSSNISVSFSCSLSGNNRTCEEAKR